jgi:predicted nucleotidyltransferase
VDISSTCKVGQKLGMSAPSVDMLPFGVAIPATVPQRSEFPEDLMNYPVDEEILTNVTINRFRILSPGTA